MPDYFKKPNFFLPAVDIKDTFGHRVLRRLVPCIEDMGIACGVLHGQKCPVYLLQVSKNEGKKHSVLK